MGRGKSDAEDIFYGDTMSTLEASPIMEATIIEEKISTLIKNIYDALRDTPRNPATLQPTEFEEGGALLLESPGDYWNLWQSKPFFDRKELERRRVVLSLEIDDPPGPRLTLQVYDEAGQELVSSSFVGQGAEEKDVILAIEEIERMMKKNSAPWPNSEEILHAVRVEASRL